MTLMQTDLTQADAPALTARTQLLAEVRDARPKMTASAPTQNTGPSTLFDGLSSGVQSEVAPPKSPRVASYEPAPRTIVADAVQVAAVTTVQESGPLKADAIYEPYHPQRLHVSGAKPHPTPLVQSAAMASVLPPVPTYAPALPLELITNGTLSEAQLEAVVYAGQAHRQFLEPIVPEGETEPVTYRKGWFCGDSTGVGKGRILAACILDHFARGGTKALWISATPKLIKDARRDWVDLGGREDEVIDLGKIKAGEPIRASRGILFLTYGLLKSDIKDAKGKSRMKQVIDWLGDPTRFDGVVAFDESHKLKTALAKKTKRGTTRASDTAIAGCELQRKLPNARVVYASATGATEVSNLAYCDRLGLWGRGTAFPNKREFVNQIESGGVAAMELVARDMKQMGLYMARSLSFDGVAYDRITHILTPHQCEMYDKLCEAWQVVLNRIDEALEETASFMNAEGDRVVDGKIKGAAYSAFWGAHQRFFNQILCALQMPKVLEDVEEQLALGHCAVLQLVNTNEAAQERQLAKLEEDDDLTNIDMTPRDQLLQLVDRCFPIAQYEEVKDEDGNVHMEIVHDSNGDIVFNKEAVAMKERLIAEVSTIRCPDGPLEMLINHFGPNNVAEVTGRGRRIVRAIVDGTEKTYVETRSPMKCMAEAAEFQDDKRRILVFSDAGGTGASYHASTKVKNQRRRIHYLVQAGWVADAAVQGFGRTHRSDQVVAPLYKLVSTNLRGHARFLSSIARRLDQLGALTKGQRQAAAQGIFKQSDNLESDYAREALYQLYRDIHAGKVEGIPLSLFTKQTGLKLIDKEGKLLEELPPITRFLNRLLSMQIAPQNRLFEAFEERMEAKVRKAIDEGTMDVGVETITADRAKKVSEQVVYTHPVSGAQTKHVVLTLGWKSHPVAFDTLLEGRDATAFKRIEFFAKNARSGKVYAFVDCGERTMPSGNVVPHYYQIGPMGKHPIPKGDLRKSDTLRDKYGNYAGVRLHWEVLTPEQARPLWDKQVVEVPEFTEERLDLITGAVLPIWDRLRGNPKVKRLATDEGERLLGRVVPEEELHDTLQRLGAESAAPEWKPQLVIRRLQKGSHYFVLANGWKLKSCFLHGEKRYELVGPDYTHMNELRAMNVFYERVDWAGRFFIPVDRAEQTIAAITKTRPITSCQAVGK